MNDLLAAYLAAEMRRYFPDATHVFVYFYDETTVISVTRPPAADVLVLSFEAGSDDDWYTFSSHDDGVVLTIPLMPEA